ncbi:hypothetical protein SLS60_002470 [Paraconiothyrium brasiliense]|uniref:Uncharacterized protein n=1 Tax=Paraconiothyrium brasiliense TaxID=300254 RepID=A0ABR3S3B3_9PLEO
MASSPAPPTRQELEAWAQEAFPEDWALFKAEVDKIMKPVSLPYGYDPNYAAGPKPEYRDWERPTQLDATRLGMQSHMILIIGSFKRERPGKVNRLFIYMTPGKEFMKFGRQVFEGKLPRHESMLDREATMSNDVYMYPFWKMINQNDPNRRDGRLVKTVAVYFHLLRWLLPDFRGQHAMKADFEAAVKAYAQARRDRDRRRSVAPSAPLPQQAAPPPSPFAQPPISRAPVAAPIPSQVATTPANQAALPPSQVRRDGKGEKRGRAEDAGDQERAKRMKGAEDRVKELEERLNMVEQANTKQLKELRDENKQLKDENKQLKEELGSVKAENARKGDQLATIHSVLGDQYCAQ